MRGESREAASKEVARFLRSRHSEILSRWEKMTAECVPESQKIPWEQWRDHMPELIERLVWIGETVASGQRPREHGLAEIVALTRLDQGLEFLSLYDELTLLRLSVMQAWRDTRTPRSTLETEILEEMLGYLLRQVVRRYSDTRESILRALDRVGEVGLERRAFDDLLHGVAEIIVQEVPGVDSAAILLREGNTLRLRATVGLEASRRRDFSLKVGEGFAGRIAAEGRPLLLGEAEIATQVKSGELLQEGYKALYGVPLPGAEGPMGVMHIGSRQAGELPRAAIHVLRAIARRAGLVVERENERQALEQSARALALERARLSAVLEAVPDGLVVLAPDGEMIRANDRAAHLIPALTPEFRSLPREEQLRRLPFSDEAGAPLPPHLHPGERARRGEVLHSMTVQVPPSASRAAQQWLTASAAPIRAPDGSPSGAVVTFADVTGYHRLQEQQQGVIRMVSHDLRSPLSTVAMQAEIMMRMEDPDARRRARVIKTAAHRMEIMIKDLVDSTRQETGQLLLQRQPVELRSFFDSLLSHLSGVLETERLAISVPPSLPLVWADPDRLERIFINLISNALRYSAPESPVRVDCAPVEGGVSVAVKDRGIGIAGDELPRLFQRYFRSSRARATEGLGLGLAITHLLVAAHGGRIFVESKLGQGSTFTVWLPSVSADGGDAAHASPGA